MQTGYDSFWMYQNNRQEPVLNLPKNDNQSHAVLTDHYKQVQSGGHPSLLNGCIPPQNNTARSHDQHRTPHSQYVWPSSVYSMPLKPSYASNFHPQAAFSAQSNNSGYSSPYTQPNLSDAGDLRNFKNSNTSVSQVKNRNNNSVQIRDNQNNAHAGRIRVRDVFSLNKSTVPGEARNSNSYQKEQYGCYNYNSAYTTKNQSQFVNYGRGSLPPANHLPPPYYASHHMANHPGSAHQFQPSSPSCYQQNSENQHQFLTSRPVDRNLNFEASKTNSHNAPLLQALLHPEINQDPFSQTNRRVSSESVHGNEIAKGVPPRNFVQVNNSVRTINPGYGNPLDVNNGLTCERSKISNVPQIQNQQDNNAPFRSNSSSASATASVKSPVYQHSTGQETVIKISIPHSGQSTFITLSDCGSTNRSSSLPCLVDENDKFCSEWNQKSPNHDNNAKENSITNVSVPQTRQTSLSDAQPLSSVNLPSPNCHNTDTGHPKNLTVPPRKRFCQVREPFLDLNKENFNAFLNSTPLSDNSSENSISRVRDSESIARETTFQEKITLSAFQLKQENLNAAVESPGSNVTEKKVLLENIKREKNPIDDNTETQEDSTMESNEETDSVEGPLTSEVEFTEESNVDVKGFGFLPEVLEPPPDAEVVSENSTDQAENLNNPTGKRKDLPAGNKEEKQQNCLPAEVNYKSRINRNKLDMLIQFLEMDEESSESVPKRTCSKSRKETDLNHNRRKLSKNSVVKNKNNSREMIAMKSNKNSRVETSKCSPATQIAKPNSNKEREGKTSTEEKSKADESENGSESHVKSNTPRVAQREGEDSSEKSEPKNINGPAVTRSKVESEECSVKQNSGTQKAVDSFNKYRALQTSETVFCGKCNLFSTIDLFWVNLATGELNCLNCFKKITLQSESNTGNNTDGKTSRKEKSENTRENALEQSRDNNFKETCKTKCSSKSDCADGLSKSIKETIKQEPVDTVELPMPAKKEVTMELKGSNLREERQTKNSQDRSKGDMKNVKLKRRDSVSKENCSSPKPPKEGSASVKATSVETQKKDQTTEQSLKKNASKEHQDVGKKQETVRKSTQKEEELAGEHAKDRKCTEGSGQIKKRSDSKDFVSCKSPEEQSKKEARTDWTEKSFIKTKECYPNSKDNSIEPAARKSTKQEHSEKAKSQSVSKESSTSHKPKEPDSSEESRAKSTNSSEKYKKIDSTGLSRKRKNSDEDTAPVKVRIVEDQTKKDLKPVQHKASTPSALKEDIEKHKTKTTDSEMQSAKNSAQKLKRRSVSKDDGEHLSSSSKVKEEALKVDANYQKIKAYEQAKQKAGDSIEVVRRKSKEEQVIHKHVKNEVRQVVETSEKRKNKQEDGSHFGEPCKHGSVTTENKERKKTEEKEKNHSSRKLDTSSRLLKENQNTKVRSEKNKDKREHKKSSEERKDDKKEKGTSEKDDKKKLGSSSDKKKLPDRLEGKSGKIQMENRHGKAFEKVLESYLGAKTESELLTKAQGKHSAHLLSKLIKKTKKLSWSLLSEA